MDKDEIILFCLIIILFIGIVLYLIFGTGVDNTIIIYKLFLI